MFSYIKSFISSFRPDKVEENSQCGPIILRVSTEEFLSSLHFILLNQIKELNDPNSCVQEWRENREFRSRIYSKKARISYLKKIEKEDIECEKLFRNINFSVLKDAYDREEKTNAIQELKNIFWTWRLYTKIEHTELQLERTKAGRRIRNIIGVYPYYQHWKTKVKIWDVKSFNLHESFDENSDDEKELFIDTSAEHLAVDTVRGAIEYARKKILLEA